MKGFITCFNIIGVMWENPTQPEQVESSVKRFPESESPNKATRIGARRSQSLTSPEFFQLSRLDMFRPSSMPSSGGLGPKTPKSFGLCPPHHVRGSGSEPRCLPSRSPPTRCPRADGPIAQWPSDVAGANWKAGRRTGGRDHPAHGGFHLFRGKRMQLVGRSATKKAGSRFFFVFFHVFHVIHGSRSSCGMVQLPGCGWLADDQQVLPFWFRSCDLGSFRCGPPTPLV